MPKLGLVCTAGNDGYLRLWHASTVYHISHSVCFEYFVSIFGFEALFLVSMLMLCPDLQGLTVGGKHVRAVPPTKTIMSLTVLVQSSMIAVGSDDFKIRFFDPYSLRHELTFDCEGQWPFSMVSFLFPDDQIDQGLGNGNWLPPSDDALLFDDPIFATDKKGYSGWVCWGDGDGQVHFMPEKAILTFRTQHEVVPFFRSGVGGLWDLKIFRGMEHATSIWVTALLFLPDIGLAGCIIAAGSNGHVCVVSFETRRVFHYYIQHRLSVKALSWCGRQNNMLASAGLDRDIHLWRPVAIRNGKPILAGTLVGHGAGVTALVFHEKRDVLFSLDSHSITLVWDLSSRALVTKMNPITQNPFDISGRVRLIMVNQRTRHLITATNHLKYWGVRALDLRDGSNKLVPHVSEIVITLYNKTFDHVLTGDRNGLISLWKVNTGAQMFKFYCENVQETYGPPVLSAASFDTSQRRLILGWNQGSVQVYNFSNGTILRTLHTDSTAKVTAVGQFSFQRSKEVHHYFTAAFEDGLLLQWADDINPSDLPVRKIEVPNWMNKLNGSTGIESGIEFSEIGITSMAAGSILNEKEIVSVLVTLRSDGNSFFWDITTGFLLRGRAPCKKGSTNEKTEKKRVMPERGGDGQPASSPISVASPPETPGGAHAPMAGTAAKEALCVQITESDTISATCIKILHRCHQIAFIADSRGILYVMNISTREELGRFTSSRSGRHVDDAEYDASINAIEIDFTDSFLITGDEMGSVQVWDISQVFDDAYAATMSMVIDTFRWSAHLLGVTHIQHLRTHNVIITTGREELGVCLMWSISGQKIGCFGDNQWTKEAILKAIELGEGAGEEELLEETYADEEDEPAPHYQKVISNALTTLASAGKEETVELSALKGMLHKDRRQRGITKSIFTEKDRTWKTPATGDTPSYDDDDDEAPSTKGQLSITIEALQHLPSLDKYSQADPYAKIRVDGFPVRYTRTFLNQNNPIVNQTFLFYIESMEHRVKIEVWDHDAGGEEHHDLVGSLDASLGHLLVASNSAQCRMPLLRGDGSGAGLLGSVAFKVDFQPIQSTLKKALPQTIGDHIRWALRQQGVVAVPLLKSFAQPDPETKDRHVTFLATARWTSSDFRHLSVYHLHDALNFSNGSLTERNTQRTRGRHAGRNACDDIITHGDGPAPVVHRFSNQTSAGRLERGLDLALTDVLSSPLHAAAISRGARISAMKKSDKIHSSRLPIKYVAEGLAPFATADHAGIVQVHGVDRKAVVSLSVYFCIFLFLSVLSVPLGVSFVSLLCLSVSLYVSLSLSVFPTLSLFLSFSAIFCSFQSLSVPSISLCSSLFLCASLRLSASFQCAAVNLCAHVLSLSFSSSFSRSFSLSLSLSLSISLSLSAKRFATPCPFALRKFAHAYTKILTPAYPTLWQYVHCNTLQHTLQHSATLCNALQRTATHCNALQRTATHCNTLQHTDATLWQYVQHEQRDREHIRRKMHRSNKSTAFGSPLAPGGRASHHTEDGALFPSIQGTRDSRYDSFH